MSEDKPAPRTVKCVIWDLDNTLWDGVLLEDREVCLRPDAAEVIRLLDERGILHSIASRNDYEAAAERLQQLEIWDYFLYPQINWSTKSSSITAIADALNLSIDAFAFVDDDPFEQEEVAFTHKGILCIDVGDVMEMPIMPEMQPRFLTEDAKMRRQLYKSDSERAKAEQAFMGTHEEFLATLNMVFSIASAHEEDLQRAEELTVRTHQLNTTGYTYSYEELNAMRTSKKYKLLIAGLEDKYGPYGKIGLALAECLESIWTIKLLLMSCRVISRGVGTILLNHIIRLAQEAGVRLQAEFIPNNRNRMMLVTYAFSGFREVEKCGNMVVFEHDSVHIQPFPDYMKVVIEV